MEDYALENFVAAMKLEADICYNIVWFWSDWINEELYGWMEEKKTDKAN